MSKTKNKSHSEVDHLRGQIRKLESQNRQLKRRVKELNKKTHLYEDKLLEEVTPDITLEKVDTCPDCKRGHLELKDFKFIKFLVCSLCEYKEKVE